MDQNYSFLSQIVNNIICSNIEKSNYVSDALAHCNK